jgi:hypothetical protein
MIIIIMLLKEVLTFKMAFYSSGIAEYSKWMSFETLFGVGRFLMTVG